MVYGQSVPSAQVSPRVQDCTGVGTEVLHLHLGQLYARLLLGLDRVQEAVATGCTISTLVFLFLRSISYITFSTQHARFFMTKSAIGGNVESMIDQDSPVLISGLPSVAT